MKKLTLFSALLLTTTIFAQVPAYVPTNGLVGWWPFNGNANDESGNGNYGTVNGPTLTTDRNGVINSAFSFDGIDDKIEVQNSPNLNFGINPTFTISFWLNKSNLISSGVMCKAEPYNGFGWTGWNYYNDDFSTGYPCLNNPILVSPNIWEFIVVIVDNGNITKFVNDQIYGQHSCSQITTNSISTIHNMYFGVDRDIANYFLGSLDDIGIWNRALTEQEILALYQGCQMSITAQPTNQSVNLSSGNASFNVVSNATNPIYQWQTNVGVGFQNIGNNGQYSGVNTDNLMVSNLTPTNDNQAFRCIISDVGCEDTSDVATLYIIDDASISTQIESNILLSPNPVSNDFSISGIEQIVSLSLKDVSGKLIKTFDVQDKNHSMSNVISGVYFLEVRAENRMYIIKVMKK